MPLQISIKKFKSINNDIDYRLGLRAACIDEKNTYLIKRLFKQRRYSGKRMMNKWYNNIYIANSYRNFWFCKDCLHVFRLKPLKKYKVLQAFELKCSYCNSESVNRNDLLTRGIIDKKLRQELLVLCKNEIELDYEWKRRTYYLIINNINLCQVIPNICITLN